MLNKIKTFLSNLLTTIKHLVPTRLPQGIQEFETWTDEIISHYKMPNNDSIKFALATAITHLGPEVSHKAKAYFGKLLSKGASTQVAFYVMDQLKAKQKAASEAAATQVATASTSSTPSATTPQATN